MYKAVSGLPRGFAAIVVACLLCLPLIASADGLPQTGRDAVSGIVAGQVVVRFRDNADSAAVARILQTYPVQSERAGLYRLAAPVGAEAAVAAQLQVDPAVELASVNPVIPAPVRRAAPPTQKSTPGSGAAMTAASVSEDAVPPPPPPGDSQPGATTPNRIARFWLSDRKEGPDPSPSPENLGLVGMCGGARFNAGRPIWANIYYENMETQTLRVQVYSLGAFFNNRTPQEQLGYGWSVSVAGYNQAFNTIQNVSRLPVGCYQVRLYSSLDSFATPLASVYFQIVTTSPEIQWSSSLLWHLDHTRADDGTDPPKRWVDIKASGAWNITTGAETTIAVIGYGVNINHPKLKDHIWTDKLDPNLHGWNFDTNSPDITDDYGEGTFLAGLIAAEPDGLTSNGGLGVNWGTKIMPLRITYPYNPAATGGVADAANIISAIRWAREKHADIIFVSLWFKLAASGGREQQFKQLLRQEIQLAQQDGIVVVAPVGNVDTDGGEQFGDDIYPASLQEVLTVSTTDQADQWFPGAYKNSLVDVAAPGLTYMYGINDPHLPWLPASDRVDPAWVYGDTMFSAALVTGVVGLMRSVNPNLRPDDIQNLLRDWANKVDTANHSYDDPGQCGGWNEYLGCGRVNAERTLWHVTHELHGAFSISPITAATPGQQCVRLENKRTGAVTWQVEVQAPDQDWVTVSGPFSARSTDQFPDYQGALPSFAKVCVNLGAGAGQRSYGYHPVTLKVSSTMPNHNAPENITLPVTYQPFFHRVFLPSVSVATSIPGH